ncbi:MAG: imidazolonepropionase [Thermoplasmata archaeon]
MSIDLIVKNCSELHTMRGPNRARTEEEMKDTGLIEDGALAVDDGNVVDVGTTEEIENKYDANNVVDASGKAVIPGFVDPHTHLVYSGSREDELIMKIKGKTYMEILEAGGGILRTVKATRNASKDELKEVMKKRMDRMLKYGTTTAEAKSGYGLDLDNEVKSLEVIKEMSEEHPIDLVPTYLGAHSLPPEFDDTGEYIDYCVEEVLPQIKENDLAEFCDVFCEKGVFDSEESKKLLKKAKNLGMKVKVHADEIENIGCSKMAAEIGAISAEHLVKTSMEDIKKMAEAGTIAISLPGTPFMLMEDEYTPVRKMIENDVPIALATDLNPNCWTESMQMIITLASLQMKMEPEEVLTACTVNSAYAIDREYIGVLDEGYKADFLILEVPNIMHLPYHFGVNLVESVYKGGNQVI